VFLTRLQNVVKVIFRKFKYFISSRSQKALFTAKKQISLWFKFTWNKLHTTL